MDSAPTHKQGSPSLHVSHHRMSVMLDGIEPMGNTLELNTDDRDTVDVDIADTGAAVTVRLADLAKVVRILEGKEA